MKPPDIDLDEDLEDEDLQIDFDAIQGSDLSNYVNPYRQKFKRISNVDDVRRYQNTFFGFETLNTDMSSFCHACRLRQGAGQYPPNALRAVEGVSFVAKHLKIDDNMSRVSDQNVLQ